MIELFRRYPGLARTLPWTGLGVWPTPVGRLEGIADGCRLYIKNDGPSGPLYGGNKVRKLEFLLAEAMRRGAGEVMTFGVAGSNHALATALYAESLGLRGISILTPQTNARYVARNLLAGLSTNAELHHYGSERAAALGARWQRLRHRRRANSDPMIVAGGGSSPLGTVGFVNAAFELHRQIRAGQLPAPDRLYVALGTMGTAAGLLLGLRACGLDCELVAVRVVRESIANDDALRRLYEATNRLLHGRDAAFPLLPFDPPVIRHEQFGKRYAVFTPEGMAAKSLLANRAGLSLEGTYTAKAMAALLSDLSTGRLDGRTVLYWHTYNSVSLEARIAGLDYRNLPADFHRYFEQPVQALDA